MRLGARCWPRSCSIWLVGWAPAARGLFPKKGPFSRWPCPPFREAWITREMSSPRRQQSVWPWLLLGVWLMASAAQIWALEVESVAGGDARQPPA